MESADSFIGSALFFYCIFISLPICIFPYCTIGIPCR